jgi:hypothetical protein
MNEKMNQNSPSYNSYNPDKGRHSFETASLVSGILSLLLLCTGVLSIPAGAMGILFSRLSRKGKNPMSGMSTLGLVFSIIGLIAGTLVSAYAIYMVLTDPSVIEEVRQMYARYGLEMPEYPIFLQQ